MSGSWVVAQIISCYLANSSFISIAAKGKIVYVHVISDGILLVWHTKHRDNGHSGVNYHWLEPATAKVNLDSKSSWELALAARRGLARKNYYSRGVLQVEKISKRRSARSPAQVWCIQNCIYIKGEVYLLRMYNYPQEDGHWPTLAETQTRKNEGTSSQWDVRCSSRPLSADAGRPVKQLAAEHLS